MPEGEDLAMLAASGATLVLHLSINNLARVVRELAPRYGLDCPAAIVHRASWPEQRILRGTLGTIRAQAKAAGMTRTALILVGRVLEPEAFADSRLYAADHHHVLRPRLAQRGRP
jgi:precorrin-4/cobalt-precorrin-4 C11-methyltransferase